jgi:chemotaxis protein methyltransferase CheR
MAMTLLEHAREEALAKVKIRATDISTRILECGRSGIYAADRLKDVPYPVLQRNMLKGRTATGDSFRFKPEVRAMIVFEHLNLMRPLPAGYCCSVIFCRNIMIYFDKPTQESLVGRLTQQLEDGGYLFIGHSESLSGIRHTLDYVCPATYRKPVNPRSAKDSAKMGGA